MRLLPFCGDDDCPVDRGREESQEVSYFTWHTASDGSGLVDRRDGDGALAVSLVSPQLMGLADKVAAQWGPLAKAASIAHGVPLSWILGVILQESAGDPSAESPMGAIGLMQIIPKWHPTMTKEQLLDPEQNVDYGTSLLADSIAAGFDLPEAASRYNGGAESNAGRADTTGPTAAPRSANPSATQGPCPKARR